MFSPPSISVAPCSFGVAVGDETNPQTLLAEVSRIGVDGLDLGPPGFLGDEVTLGPTLARHELSLSGGWVELGTGHDGMGDLERVLALFSAAAEHTDGPPARPTLGVVHASDPRDGSAHHDDVVTLVERAAERASAAGFPATLHPHLETAVVGPVETVAVLERVDVGLCLDTAHWALGGWDLVADAVTWAHRIDHLHVKDLSTRRHARPTMAHLRSEVREAGDGDLDLVGVLAAVPGTDWVVVEQDRDPGGGDVPAIADAQSRSVHWLRERCS